MKKCSRDGRKYWKRGDVLKVDRVKGGHVFAWMDGPRAPDSQYLHCITCLKPYHELFPAKPR